MTDLKFLEVEHKYVVNDGFNPSEFLDKVLALNPKGQSIVSVQDTYYLVKATEDHIFRHRVDEEIQHLTVKSLTKDPDVRKEVNLDLGLHCGDQGQDVAAFLEPLGIKWQGVIAKKVWAYYFDEVEVVYYEANHGSKAVRCIEIEGKSQDSLEKAKEQIASFESRLGLDPKDRAKESLFHLLLLPAIQSQN